MGLWMAESIRYVIEKYSFQELRATVRSVPVLLQWNAQNSGKSVSISAMFEPVLDLGLHVFASLSPFGNPPSVTLNDEQFTGIFSNSCADGESPSVTQVLSSSVRAELLELARLGSAVMTDDGVRCFVEPSLMTGNELSMVIEACVNVATSVRATVTELTPPAQLRLQQVAQALIDACKTYGYTVRAHPFSILGSDPNFDLTLHFQTQFAHRLFAQTSPALHSRPGYVARVAFREPLALGLRLRSSSFFDRAQSFVGIKDLQVGDGDFDQRWTIAARDEEHARAVLHAETRGLLTALANVGLELSLDDSGLSGVGSLPTQSADAMVLLAKLSGLYEALHKRTESGPYR
jgi:hypothetical protein